MTFLNSILAAVQGVTGGDPEPLPQVIPLDVLLVPLPGGRPCGEDPSVAGGLFALESAIQGKAETQFSAAEEPDWKALKLAALEVAKKAKDLRVAGILSATLLRTDGLLGFCSGVQLLRGYVEGFWSDVYPPLDTSDNNDPAERINALTNISAPLATDGDVLRIISALRSAPLLVGPRVGQFTLNHYLCTKGFAVWPANAGEAPTAALLEAAQKDAAPGDVKRAIRCAKTIIADLDAMEAFFKEKAGAQHFPSFELLRRELKQVLAWLGGGAVLGGASPSVIETMNTAGKVSADEASSSGVVGISGTVRNRNDVVIALDSIIAYYKQQEPSSPVPFILARVRRLVIMNFMEVITELNPDALDKILNVTGPVQPSDQQKS